MAIARTTRRERSSELRMWTREDGSTLVQFPAETHACQLCNLTGWVSYVLRQKGEAPTQAGRSCEKSWFSNADETFYFEATPAIGDCLLGFTHDGKEVILYQPENLLALYAEDKSALVESYPGIPIPGTAYSYRRLTFPTRPADPRHTAH